MESVEAGGRGNGEMEGEIERGREREEDIESQVVAAIHMTTSIFISYCWQSNYTLMPRHSQQSSDNNDPRTAPPHPPQTTTTAQLLWLIWSKFISR